MTSGRIIGPEDATVADLFQVLAATLVRMERTEEVLCLVAGLLLNDMGKIRHAAPEGSVDEVIAQIADYMLLISDAEQRSRVDVAFLQARE